MGWLNINGNWIGRNSGKSWSSYWTQQNILQKLDFSMDADKKLLLDVSGNGNNGKLVNSNCTFDNASRNIGVISTDPEADNMLFSDFSVEFYFSITDTITANYAIFGRTNGGLFNNLLSLFWCTGGNLTYYSASGSANSAVVIINTLVQNTIYHVKASINNTAGTISWEVNGTAGSANFTNRTPVTNQANDYVAMGRVSGFYGINGKLFGVKYYTGLNYTNLTHYWPCAEGKGVTIYDVVGGKDLTLASETSKWSTQDEYHYNLTKGFQLFGNSSVIRVPYNNDGTKKDPTIVGYTNFADCDAGTFHNFAETGIKRNYLNVAALTSAGVANTNVIYYGSLSGYSGYGYCKNYMGLETDYTLYSVAETLTTYRKTFFGYALFSNYIRDTVTKVLIAGSTGKIHSINLKNIVASAIGCDVFIKNGAYNLTNATTELQITIPEDVGVVGESKSNTIINGHLAADTAVATIAALSTFGNSNGNGFRLANLTATAQNMRYVVHDDGTEIAPIKRIYNVKLEHYGNHDAYLIDPLVFLTCDAYGSGYQDNLDLIAEDSEFIGHESDGGAARGFATHHRWEAPYTNPAILKFNRCIFNSNGSYPFRWSTGPTTKNDRCEFAGCNFNGKQIYFDPTTMYDLMADKVNLFKDATDIAPIVDCQADAAYIGLKVETGITKTLTINTGTVATLLLSSEKTITSYTVIGRKNITDSVFITGAVGLKGLLGDCSGTPKVLSVKIDGVDTNITFNQNYSAMTNAQVLTSINGINADIQFSEYSYGANAAVVNL